MTASVAPRAAPASSSLYDVLDLILDKGLVVDAYVRVSVVGIELITIDARIVIASVDTYLRFAEAANRLDLEAKGRSVGLPDLVGMGGSSEGQEQSLDHQKQGQQQQGQQQKQPEQQGQ